MGITGSLLADQAPKLEGQYALVLDSENSVHSFPGPAGADNESADKWLELQVVQWRGTPTLVLKLAAASSDAEFKEHLDESTDSVQFVFKLPADYPGGRPALLRNIRELLDGAGPHGIQEAIFSKKEICRFLASIPWARKNEKDTRWTNAGRVYGCQVSWTQFSSQGIFRFRVGTGESALLVVDKNADTYKSATDQQSPPQQQLNFVRLITLPVRVWMCIQYRHSRIGDASQGHEPSAAIHDVSPLDSEEGSSTGVLGKLKKRVESTTRYVVNAAGVDNVDECELVTGEHPGPDRRSPVQGVVSPSEGKTEEGQNLPMETKKTARNRRKKAKKKASRQAVKGVHANAQPQQDQDNDEQSAPASGSAAGPVVADVDIIDADWSPAPATTASFRTAWSSPFSRISTSSRNMQTPPLAPNDAFTGGLDDQGVSEHQSSRALADSETTLVPGDSCEPSQDKMSSSEITTGAVRESDERRTSATATPAKTTIHPLEISPHAERESQYPTSTVNPVPGAMSQSHSTRNRRKKRKARRAPWKAEDGLDNTCAATAHVEAQQQEVPPQGVSGFTGQPLQPQTEPASAPATHHQSPKKDKEQQQAGYISTVAEALQSLDISQESTALAEGRSSVSGSATPRLASRQLLGINAESAEFQPSSTAAMTQSHPQWNESSSAATTTTPWSLPRPVVTVGRENRREAPIAAVPPATTPRPSAMAVVPAGRARTRAPPTDANPARTPSIQAVVTAGRYQEGGFVPGVNPARTPGPMMAAVTAGAHGGFAPSPTVAPGYGAHNQEPSQRHQATTPAATFWQENPAASPDFFQGEDNQTSGGGANQTPPTLMDSAPFSEHDPSTEVVYKKKELEPGKFFWDLTNVSFECSMEGCAKRCHLWDCQTVICPFCGPFSRIMYCGKDHLRADVRNHWLQGCRQASFEDFCKEDSVPREIRAGPPAIPTKHGWDSPEHHRQAVFFSSARREGDYFLFADWDDHFAVGGTMDAWAGRCSPFVIGVVRFDDPVEKDCFRRVLAVCLLKSVEVQPLVTYMFRLLRDKIRARSQWTPDLDAKIRRQLYWELGVFLDPALIGERHACETEWSGRSPRHCSDPICVAERQYYPDSMWYRRGFERRVYQEECSHWLLRASRTTHPTVSDVYARTPGEGFDDVVEEERRLFARGEGWDGAGTGPMEMEGPVWC